MIYTLLAFYLIVGYLSYTYVLLPVTDIYLPMFHGFVREPKSFFVFTVLWLPVLVLAVLSTMIDILIGRTYEDMDEDLAELYNKYEEKKRAKKK